jgi:hypothetical protein
MRGSVFIIRLFPNHILPSAFGRANVPHDSVIVQPFDVFVHKGIENIGKGRTILYCLHTLNSELS